MVLKTDPRRSTVRVRASARTRSSVKRQPVISTRQLMVPPRRSMGPSTRAPARRNRDTRPAAGPTAPSSSAVTTSARTRRAVSQFSAFWGSSAATFLVRRSANSPWANLAHSWSSASVGSATGGPGARMSVMGSMVPPSRPPGHPLPGVMAAKDGWAARVFAPGLGGVRCSRVLGRRAKGQRSRSPWWPPGKTALEVGARELDNRIPLSDRCFPKVAGPPNFTAHPGGDLRSFPQAQACVALPSSTMASTLKERFRAVANKIRVDFEESEHTNLALQSVERLSAFQA
jgi:hypothetical protein